ncbi:MAG: hypothetical protein HQL32_12860 [Planctomycetes bacterium]|nr:hypothetical protein [Planctomycetota bacterium]
MSLFLLLLTATFNFLLGVLVMVKGDKKPISFSFFFFSSSLSLWCLTWFFALLSSAMKTKLLLSNLMLVGPAVTAPAFLYFSIVFPSNTTSIGRKGFLSIYLIPSFFFILISPLKAYVETISPVVGNMTFTPGWAYMIYTVYFTTFILISFYNLFRKYLNSSKIEKMKLLYIFLGTFLAAVIAMTVNLFLPLLKVTDLNVVGPISTISIVSFTAYAILKHELMDIKVVLTQSISYLVSSALLVVSGITPYLLLTDPILIAIITIPLMLFWAMYFIPISEFLITSAKRKFIKGYYEPEQVMTNFIHFLCRHKENETKEKTFLFPIMLGKDIVLSNPFR